MLNVQDLTACSLENRQDDSLRPREASFVPPADATDTRYPHTRIAAGQSRPAINITALASHFDLLLSLAVRDVKVRYKQTVLGMLWVVLQPLLAALIFSFVFGLVAGLGVQGRPYLLFAFAGLMAWNLFANTVTRSSTAILSNASMVTKIYFPREVLPVSAVCSAVLDFGVTLGVMAIMLAFWRVWPGAGLLLLPVWTGLVLLLGLGIGLMAGALMVRFRDIHHIITTLLTLGLYASPVAWPASAVPARYRLVYLVNPLSGPLDTCRWSLLGIGTLPVGSLAYSAVAALLVLWLGAKVFQRMERSFADVL
jgi:lipopolysaccharide transport system permease protein